MPPAARSSTSCTGRFRRIRWSRSCFEGPARAMIVERLGSVAYELCFEAMRAFTAAREPATPDEIWLCEHPPVFTQGIAGKAEHVLDPGAIPVIQSDRGG